MLAVVPIMIPETDFPQLLRPSGPFILSRLSAKRPVSGLVLPPSGALSLLTLYSRDILHCRARTTGITETVFRLRTHELHLVDVGGQKSER